ncbi:hypothetical protein OKW30_006195 [Paraburkholderia sp. Clong3]|nr:hypothetical protein [Paraburkholderia sp. CI2]
MADDVLKYLSLVGRVKMRHHRTHDGLIKREDASVSKHRNQVVRVAGVSVADRHAVGLVLLAFGQGGMFTLRALSFGVVALAVWAMGIETKGLALETLVSRVQPQAARLRVAIDDVR